LLFAVGAYGFWGFVPLYFKAVRAVGPAEVLAHRIVWSAVTVAVVVALLGRSSAVMAAVRAPGRVKLLALSSVLVATNWLLFIWAVTSGRILESSLGYYINPIVSVLLGSIVLRERLHAVEWSSVGLAACAVLWLTVSLGVFPTLPLALALTFGFYGLVRKSAKVGAIEGLAIETALLLPLALGYLVWLGVRGELAFGHRSLTLDLLLAAAGPVTAIPLLCFAAAVSRLRLATMGLMQYLSPTIQFVLAVAVYREPFGRERLIAFVLIWAALALFAGWNSQAARRVVPPAAE
jgi:chloramphenicol-sensitive protein RarD